MLSCASIRKRLTFGVAVGCVAMQAAVGAAQSVTLVPQALAARLGLERVWATRVEVDPLRSRVESIVLDDGLLVAQTGIGTYQAIDPESGFTFWTKTVGNANYPSLPAAVGDGVVVGCNGTMLYALDRAAGFIEWERPVDRPPTAGLAVGGERVYMPCLDGNMMGFPLRRELIGLQTPVTFAAVGIPAGRPMITNDAVLWSTLSGRLYCCDREQMTIRYMYRANDGMHSPPAYSSDTVFVARKDGYVQAIDLRRGRDRWRFSIGRPVFSSPIYLDGDLYVIESPEGMSCLNAVDGKQKWRSPMVAGFVSASATRLYTTDEIGRLMVLDRRSGLLLGTMDTLALSLPVPNIQNDRIYLASPTGLVQCLRELGATRPLAHNLPPAPPADAAAAGAQPATTEPGTTEPPPAGDPSDPFANPFGTP